MEKKGLSKIRDMLSLVPSDKVIGLGKAEGKYTNNIRSDSK